MVLLDYGLSGDLLFVKKGSIKHIPIVKQAVPQSWGTSNGTFNTDKVGDIEISFVGYSNALIASRFFHQLSTAALRWSHHLPPPAFAGSVAMVVCCIVVLRLLLSWHAVV
jgi:hypothetical protein